MLTVRLKSFSEVEDVFCQSGFLGLRDYIALKTAQKREKDWLEFARWFHPSKSYQLSRLNMWRASLNSGKFNEQEYLSNNRITTCSATVAIPDDSSGVSLVDPVIEKYRRSLNGIDIDAITRFSSGVEGEIMRDVLRTYQNDELFQENHIGRKMLIRILVAVSRSADSTVGYCQGMNFVVGIMVHCALSIEQEYSCSPTEQEQIESVIFDLMLALIEKSGKLSMLGLWAEKIPRLKLRVYQLDRLLRWFCPRLHSHFATIELSPEVLTAQWFITLFGYCLGARDTMRVWDYVFLGGWEGLFRVAVALLASVEDTLLNLQDMEGVSLLMKKWRCHTSGMLTDELNIDNVFKRATSLIITDEVLLKLQEAYANELIALGAVRHGELDASEQLLNQADGSRSYIESSPGGRKQICSEDLDKPSYWLQRYAYKLSRDAVRELVTIKSTLEVLDAQIDRDKELMTHKILSACESQQLIDDHYKILENLEIKNSERLNRLRRRLKRCLSRAEIVAKEAESVLFAMQQVQKLDDELRLLQSSGKAPYNDDLKAGKAASMSSNSILSRMRQRLGTYHASSHRGESQKLRSKFVFRSNNYNECGQSQRPPSFPNFKVSHNRSSQFVDNKNESSLQSAGQSICTADTNYLSRYSESSQSLDNRLNESPNGDPLLSRQRNISKRERLRALIMPNYDSCSKSEDFAENSEVEVSSPGLVVSGLQSLLSSLHDMLSPVEPSSSLVDIGSHQQSTHHLQQKWLSAPLNSPSLSSLFTSASSPPLTGFHFPSTPSISNENIKGIQFPLMTELPHLNVTDDEIQLIGDADRDSLVLSGEGTESISYELTLSRSSKSSGVDFSQLPQIGNEHGKLLSSNNLKEFANISNDDPALKLAKLEKESRETQKRLILLQRLVIDAERTEQHFQSLRQHLELRAEEISDFKSRLCDQLHLLVEDSNRGRSQKLLYVADNFLI